ncbi:MAG: hypothetical protein J7559_16510 [Cohnella sp.]|nr:hypothetical protein [Cohnella sp.]
MKRNRLQGLAVALIVPALLLGGIAAPSPRHAHAEPAGVRLPPGDVMPFSIFNPNHLYLDSGSCSITAKTGSVVSAANTSANQSVDSIGVTIYVQKWNGTSWENFGAGNTLGGNDTAYYSNAVSKTVTPGYYYRTRSIHWVIENGVYEQGENVSGSVLVS